MHIEKRHTVCFSGLRAEKLPKDQHIIERIISDTYKQVDIAVANGSHTFLFGACNGFDLIAANEVLVRKHVVKRGDPKEIFLVAVVPFEEQAASWDCYWHEMYYRILAQCDEVITLNLRYKRGCYAERNQYLVEHSSRLICYWDGQKGGTAQTVSIAQNSGLEIVNLALAKTARLQSVKDML